MSEVNFIFETPPNVTDRSNISTGLIRERGTTRALFDGLNGNILRVKFDRNYFSELTLLSWLRNTVPRANITTTSESI